MTSTADCAPSQGRPLSERGAAGQGRRGGEKEDGGGRCPQTGASPRDRAEGERRQLKGANMGWHVFVGVAGSLVKSGGVSGGMTMIVKMVVVMMIMVMLMLILMTMK